MCSPVLFCVYVCVCADATASVTDVGWPKSGVYLQRCKNEVKRLALLISSGNVLLL